MANGGATVGSLAGQAGQAISSGAAQYGAQVLTAEKGFSDFVGVVSDWLSVGSAILSLLQAALNHNPDPIPLLQDIKAGVDEALSDLQALTAQSEMFAILPLLTAAQSRLRTISLEGPTGSDVDEAGSVQDVQNAAYAFQSPFYWIRPYLEKLTFFGLELAEGISAVDYALPNQGQPSTVDHLGAKFCFDPTLSMPSFAMAISCFVPVVTAFHVKDPQTVQPFFTDLANILQNNYQTATQGLVMFPIPSFDDLHTISSRAQAPLNDVGGLSGPDGQSLNVPLAGLGGDGPAVTAPNWHGEIGAVNIYAIFGPNGFDTPLSANVDELGRPSLSWGHLKPTVNAGVILTIFPTLATLLLDQAPNSASSPPAPPPPSGGSYAPWTWFYVRMRVSNLTRFKALYLANGYGWIWTLIQQLRALSGGKPGTAATFPPTPPAEVTDRNAHWCLTQLDAAFAELKLAYMFWASPFAMSRQLALPFVPITAEQVIQRLFAVVDNSTNYPYTHQINLPNRRPRPLSLRAAIRAVNYA